MPQLFRPNIAVYQHAITVAGEVFTLTSKLPVQQRFILTAQLRRSIALVCNCLLAVAHSNTKLDLKRNSELFISVYAEIKTQIKMSQFLGHFQTKELVSLEICLDNIILFCKSNKDYYHN